MIYRMRKLLLFLFICWGFVLFGQTQTVSATIVDDQFEKPLLNVHILNMNSVKGSITNEKGIFSIEAKVNDTLFISMVGFQSLRVRVTNDWIKSKETKLKLTEKAIALEEVVVRPYNLTGYLEIDAKLIPIRENYRYGISGLPYAYEAGYVSPNAFNRVMGAIMNPADLLYNVFGKFNFSFLKRKEKLKPMRGGKKSDEAYNVDKKERQQRIDAILDKISKSGYEALTKEEKAFLFDQSKRS